MATKISHLSYFESRPFPEGSVVVREKDKTIAYIKAKPYDVLKKCINDYVIVSYKGLAIPYIYPDLMPGKVDYGNKGLRISSIDDAKSLPGFEVLNDEKLFLDTKHNSFTKKEKSDLVDRIKESVISVADSSLVIPMYETYQEVFNALGYKISIDELKELSTKKFNKSG